MEERRGAVVAEVAESASREAAAHLERTPEFRLCPRVALYASLPGEFPTGSLYALARSAGKTLLWPRVARDRIEFARCPRWEDLRPGRYGVWSPPAAAAAVVLRQGDLVLVPGLAFDGAGNRLGRGGGHYDRALAAAGSEVVAFGVAFEWQRVAAVPVEPWDVPVAAVLTERGLWRCGPG